VKLHKIEEGRDFGKTVEVLSGLAADADIILNPPDSIADGEIVSVARPQAKPQSKGEEE
jgi:multidrug efflux system membrane fusion protein